jgi:hypothetical protein
MTLTQSSTRFAAFTIGAAAIVAVAFSAASAAPAFAANVCPGTSWNINLKMRAKAPSVMALQQFLNMSADTQIAATGAGSPGMESSYFGSLTKAAVNKFQVKYAAQILTPNGLTTPTGNFFASSRAQANALCAGGMTGTTGSTTGGTTGTATGTASVAAAAQPANTLAPANAARVPFTAFTVTAGAAAVTVNSVSVTRQGPSLDTDFAGVVLIDASTGVQIGNSRVLDSNHSATIGSAITIPAGSSKTFWVAGNIAAMGSVGSGDIASFAVTAVNTASTVAGSFPIVGASNTMNSSLTIGSATVQTSSFDPNSASSQPIGTTGYRFSGVRIQAGSGEDETFKSITWYNTGSASGMQNVVTVVNGTSYPTTVDATGRYFTSVFPAGIVIPKGQSVDVYVQGDLGANATANTVAEFDIYRNTDIYLTGNTYGFGITPTIGSAGVLSVLAAHGSNFAPNSTSQPFFQGSTISVTAGTFSTIQNATSIGSQNIAVNVANQPLGGFVTNLTGEAITVQTLKIHLTTSSSTPARFTNVSLVNESGSVVAGPFDAVCDVTGINGFCGSSAETVSLSGSILFPTGTHTYSIKGQVPSAMANNVTVVATTLPSTEWINVTGNTTGNNVTPSVTSITMATMTVKAATLTIGNSTSPTSQTVVAGGANVLFANIQLDASQSGEDVRLSSIPVTITGTGSAANLSNCQVWDGTTALNTGSRVLNSSNITIAGSPAATFSFDNSLTIPKGTIKTLGVTCNVSSGATGTYTFASAVSGYSVSGSVSGSIVTPTYVGNTGPTMTVLAGGTPFVVSTDSSSPSYALVAGGTTGVTANVIKFRASNLTKVSLKLASGVPQDLTQVYLYAGSNIMTTTGTAIPANTLLGTATFTGNTVTATSTLTSTIQIPKDTDATIIVKADMATVGSNQPGVEADLVQVNYDNSQGTGNNSGSSVYGTVGASAPAGLRLFHTIPTVAADATLPSTGVADGRLAEFKISADSHGPVGIDKLTFKTTFTVGGVTNAILNVYSDAGYSNLVSGTYGSTTGQFGGVVGTVTSGTPYLFVAQTNGLQIPAGQTYYFKLTASVAGATSGTSAVTILQGDAANANGTVPALAASNFIWSDNATSTANLTTDSDWTNGYGVNGLPATGLIQTRSN